MTDEQLKEYAELLGISIDEAKEMCKRAVEARKKDNRFEAKADDGRFIKVENSESN